MEGLLDEGREPASHVTRATVELGIFIDFEHLFVDLFEHGDNLVDANVVLLDGLDYVGGVASHFLGIQVPVSKSNLRVVDCEHHSACLSDHRDLFSRLYRESHDKVREPFPSHDLLLEEADKELEGWLAVDLLDSQDGAHLLAEDGLEPIKALVIKYHYLLET